MFRLLLLLLIGLLVVLLIMLLILIGMKILLRIYKYTHYLSFPLLETFTEKIINVKRISTKFTFVLVKCLLRYSHYVH